MRGRCDSARMFLVDLAIKGVHVVTSSSSPDAAASPVSGVWTTLMSGPFCCLDRSVESGRASLAQGDLSAGQSAADPSLFGGQLAGIGKSAVETIPELRRRLLDIGGFVAGRQVPHRNEPAVRPE